jgi:hypothetical protein
MLRTQWLAATKWKNAVDMKEKCTCRSTSDPHKEFGLLFLPFSGVCSPCRREHATSRTNAATNALYFC